jgi:hypothetical protein
MAARLGPDVQRASLDGIPVFWADAPPPHEGGLLFRVGRADETLATSGISHLVEHLAMPPEPTEFDANAWTNESMTAFWAKGTLAEVTAFLGARAAALADLPTERLALEKRILEAEEASVGLDPIAGLTLPRYGIRGLGLTGLEQLGLRRLQVDDVLEWAAARFSAGNAALWVKGPFSPFPLALPDGERIPLSESRPADVELPAVILDWPGGVHLTMLTSGTPAANLGVSVLAWRAARRLRFELGLVYHVQAGSLRVAPDVVHRTVSAQCSQTDGPVVQRTMLELLDELAVDGPTESELAVQVEQNRRALQDPANVNGLLAGHAFEEIAGVPFESAATWLERLAATSADEVARELQAALETALFALPPGVECLDPRFTPIPERAPAERMAGTEFKRRGRQLLPPYPRLVVGPEGVSLALGGDPILSARYESLAALLAWPNGTRGFWSEGGMYFEVHPEHWRRGDRVADEIDRHAPPGLVVPMSADDPFRVGP